MGTPWFVVFTKSSEEFKARESLLNQDYTVYLPLMARDKRQDAGEGYQPMFPNYLFLMAEPDKDYHPVQSTPGCRRLIRFGEYPATMPSEVVDEIMAGEESHRIARNYQVGDKIRITSGAFQFAEDVIHELDGLKRCVMMLNVLGRPTRVTIGFDQVEPA